MNGTTSNVKAVFKVSDAGDPCIEANQLSTGPIQKWFQGGVLKASLTNDGSLSTTGSVIVTNNSPQVTLVDSNDSKQIRLFLSGSSCGIINDTLGSTPLSIDTTNNLVTFVGGINNSLALVGTNPLIVFDATSGTDAKIDHAGSILRFGSTVANHIQLNVATGVTEFLAIPLGPEANPTTPNQLPRKQYVDDTTMAFSVTVGTEGDPSTTSFNNEADRFSYFVPDGNAITITKLKIKFQQGSHTSGATLSYTIRVRNASSGFVADLGPISLNDTNNTAFVTYTLDIGDHVLTAGDSVTYFLSTRTGTITERAVSIGFVGTQKRIT